MASTIERGFEVLRENLEITGLQALTVSTRQQNVREAVGRGMEVLDSFLTGSYKRNTMIAPLSEADIDIFVVLNSSYYEANGQASLLDRVKYVLKKTYPKTPDISRDGQAVTISFSDFQVDVVPAFNRRGGGFLIPNTIQNEWISTDPHRHITIWSEANKTQNDDLIPLIKMIKAWNKKNGSSLTSFHLECLILHVMDWYTIRNFPSAVRYVFEYMRKSFQHVVDPVMGSSVSSYLNTQDKVDAVANQLETAYGRAKNAEEWVRKENIEDAYYYWRKIFGDYFPAYE